MKYSQQNLQGKYVVCQLADSKFIGRVDNLESASPAEQTANDARGYICIASPYWLMYESPTNSPVSYKRTTLINTVDIVKVLSQEEFISEYFEFLL